jgi:NTP pyrophosphatase (non-canonical NTP hydrolase)
MNPSKFIEAWYDAQAETRDITDKVWGPRNGEDSIMERNSKLLQIVGEVVETQDALRVGNPPSEKIPYYTSEEEELADVVLRVMDYAASNNLRIAEAMLAKMTYNSTRPFRHGGKLF